MSEAKAGRLRIGESARHLFEAKAPQPLNGRPSGTSEDFGEGQLSGPNGPKFVGLGEPVPMPLWRACVENFAFGGGVAVVLFVLMRFFHVS